MAMFGNIPSAYDMSGQTFGIDPATQASINRSAALPVAPQPAAKPGFLGEGGVGRNIIGMIGDALLQRGGAQPVYAPLMEKRREMSAELQRLALQQQAEYQRQLAMKQFELSNPTPTAVMQNYGFIGQQLGTDAAGQYLRNLGDPMVTVQLPGNRVYSGPRSGMAAALGTGSAPTAPVGKLTPIPGGGGSNAAGGFPGASPLERYYRAQ